MICIGFDKSEFKKSEGIEEVTENAIQDSKIAPPWNTYAKRLVALFEGDPQIKVFEPEETDLEDYDYVINISVYTHKKFVALDRVLIKEVDFGNVKVGIILYDVENSNVNPDIEIFADIFEGNPNVKDIITLKDPTGTEWNYLRFKPEVVQYENDDLSDPYGITSTLAEEIADEVFEVSMGMFFTTAANGENSVDENAVHNF